MSLAHLYGALGYMFRISRASPTVGTYGECRLAHRYILEDTMKTLLGLLWAFLLIYAAWVWTPAPQQPTAPLPKHTAQHNSYVADMERVDYALLQVKCPSFLDAPLGIKLCPAQELLSNVKATLQARIDSTY